MQNPTWICPYFYLAAFFELSRNKKRLFKFPSFFLYPQLLLCSNCLVWPLCKPAYSKTIPLKTLRGFTFDGQFTKLYHSCLPNILGARTFVETISGHSTLKNSNNFKITHFNSFLLLLSCSDISANSDFSSSFLSVSDSTISWNNTIGSLFLVAYLFHPCVTKDYKAKGLNMFVPYMISLAYHKHEEIFGGNIKACKNKLKTKQNNNNNKKEQKTK